MLSKKVSFRNNGRRDEEARMALAQNGEWRRAEWREGVGRKRGKHSKHGKRSEREKKEKGKNWVNGQSGGKFGRA